MASVDLVARRGQLRAEAICGARLLWPATSTGAGYPCSCSEIINAARMNPEGAGMALADDVVIMLRSDLFGSTKPAEHQACKFKHGPNEAWRSMRIDSVQGQPGGALFQLRLNSSSENA